MVSYQVVEEVPDHHDGRLSPDDAGTIDVVWGTVEDADEDLQTREQTETAIVDRAPSEEHQQSPRQNCSKKSYPKEPNAHVKCFSGWQAGNYDTLQLGEQSMDGCTYAQRSTLRIRPGRFR